MKVLCACEESQTVCKAFREKGHEAFSCDIQFPSGGHYEWHIHGDVLPILRGGWIQTMDMKIHEIGRWDMVIAFPPCTYLTKVANRAMSLDSTPAEEVVARWEKRARAIVFFMECVHADADMVAVENPIGYMSTVYRLPDQIVSPWMWAKGKDDAENYYSKKTCLWLKGLPPLRGNGIIEDFDNSEVYGKYPSGKGIPWKDLVARTPQERSKTPTGFAEAMAEQWGIYGQA